MAYYYAYTFGLNRLRIDGDIRQKAAITAIMENVVIAIYRLRPIQSPHLGRAYARSSTYHSLIILKENVQVLTSTYCRCIDITCLAVYYR